MYTPPFFKQDRAASLKFADARGFGTMCAFDGKKPIASALPFYLTYADDGTPQAVFHVARHNPLLKLADGATSWLLAVNGPDAYVSPDWYATQGRVPTWNYIAVEGRGAARRMDGDELRRLLVDLSASEENKLLPKKPWTIDKVPEEKMGGLLRAIAGFSVRFETLEGKFKLSQNVALEDFEGAFRGLVRRSDDESLAVARAMGNLER